MNKKNVAVIGSTGSIGRQTLDIIAQHPDKFSAEVLTANTQADLLIEQALKFNPNVVVIADKTQYAKVKEALSQTDIKVFAGKESIDDVVQMDCIDVVLMALVGFAGLSPTIKAIEKGKQAMQGFKANADATLEAKQREIKASETKENNGTFDANINISADQGTKITKTKTKSTGNVKTNVGKNQASKGG